MVPISSKRKKKVTEETSTKKIPHPTMKKDCSRREPGPQEVVVEVSNDKDESETESENIISAVEKGRKKTLGKQKPKTRRASVIKEVDSKKEEKKEQGRKRVKETTKRKREVSPDTEEIFAESEFKSEKGPGSRDKKRKVENKVRDFYYNAEFTVDGSLNT
ncbi:hypothetical protein KY290_038301 [Solanum tuberosum]|uniref:Uncharacterized protein n=1 Tax=Solanum tuberosum TaxID=4113 RepID=A0ABQ7TYI3_SOLTU|nr:hypothetical protein KY289_035912 [Solanum tuberosum]KAH0639102.1 hypothetical protein KY285_035688 [Solanum tuberosum]KAH0739596.1 hypothetical protein KY290_038301 [Solanum tuberosum]